MNSATNISAARRRSSNPNSCIHCPLRQVDHFLQFCVEGKDNNGQRCAS